ncbi:MAG: hypothetical protein JXM70_22555 [Pirellulales bacterium]|nr:hypothetical protein [Pirellulales bacterium]
MLYLLCGVMACVVFGSCGGGPDLPPLAPVSGTVTLDGKPIPRGTVQFSPDNSKGTRGAPAVGRIDSEGRYTLKTAGEDGAIVGFHKVRIEARREPRNEMDTMPPSLVPERYMNPDTSGLTFEVKAGEENKIDLPLTLR